MAGYSSTPLPKKLGIKEDELKAIDKQIKDIVVEAAKFAEDAPEPVAAELYTDVLVESY
jgi:pyruvate dehydrogenase E1 component alpha subunit